MLNAHGIKTGHRKLGRFLTNSSREDGEEPRLCIFLENFFFIVIVNFYASRFYTSRLKRLRSWMRLDDFLKQKRPFIGRR